MSSATSPRWAWQERLQSYEAHSGAPLPQADSLLPGLRLHVLQGGEAAFGMGDACARVFLVREGVFKQQYVDEEGRPAVKSFAGPGELFACPFALRPGGRCSFASIAIGPAVAESLDFAAVEALAAREPAWQRMLREAFQRLAEWKVERERDLLMLDAEALYRQLAQRRPALLAQVPQKDLAAYLGVTPVGLNRIVRRVRAS